MNNIPTHDDFVRSIFSDIKIAEEYFKSSLPAYIVEHLDFATLKQLPDTYLSEELKKSISDIVYSCQLKNGKGSIRVSLLIEHKSDPDKYTPIQIGGYIFSALQKQVQNKEPLSLVIPVLLYHGKAKWEYSTLKGLFKDVDREWLKFLPDYEYIFNDLGDMSNLQIEALNNKFLAASFLALKHSRQKEWLDKNLTHLLMLVSGASKELRKVFIIYLYSRGEFDEKSVNSLPETIKTDVMTTLDIYFERGIEKGIEKGIAKGRQEGIAEGIEKGKEEIVRNLLNNGNLSVSEIARLTGVPEILVKKVNTTLRKKN